MANRRKHSAGMAAAEGGSLTLADLREFVNDTSSAGIPGHAIPTVETRSSGEIRAIQIQNPDGLSQVHPYQDPLTWRAIRDQALIGYTNNGSEITANLAQHWCVTGAALSGKTAFRNTKWANMLLCRDAVLAVSSANSMLDTVGEWLKPYLGTGEEVPFLAVADGPQDTIELMVCLMKVAMWRQTVPFAEQGDFVDMILQLDEADTLMAMRHLVAPFQGINRTPAELVSELVRWLGSAGLWLHLSSRRAPNAGWGGLGAEITANLGATMTFRTTVPDQVGLMTGNFTEPSPTDQGEFVLSTGIGGPVQRGKAQYIQETHPQKPRLHDGPTVPEVSWARRNFTTKLDPRSEQVAREASTWYRDRPTSADDLYAYLNRSGR